MSIVLTGLTNSYPLPGEFAEVIFAQGPSSGATASYNAILIGNKLSSGSASVEVVYGPDTVVSMSSEADAISLFGSGSELHRMARKFFKVNTSTPCYAIAVADGYEAVAASGTIVVSTTHVDPDSVDGYSAGAAGSVRVYVADEFVDVGIATGDTAIDIASAIVSAINSQKQFGITSDNALGTSATVTLTAKQVGLRGNFIRYMAQVKGSGVATTVSVTSSTLLSGGSVSDDVANVLAVIEPFRYYYIVSAAEDATNLGKIKSQVSTQALPLNGIRQRWLAGSSAASVATVNAIAVGLNDPRGSIVWQQSSDVVPAELAANLAAVVSLVESGFSSSSLNFDSFGSNANTSGLWNIKSPVSGSAPTKLQQVSALNNGVTPIASSASGASYLVKLITSYSLNGSNPDYRVRDWHKVSVCDRYTDDLLSDAAAMLRGKTVAADPVQNEAAPVGAVTPAVFKTIINRKSRDYFEAGLLKNIAQIIANTQVQYDSVGAPNRISALIPLEPIDVLDQVAMSVQQLG